MSPSRPNQLVLIGKKYGTTQLIILSGDVVDRHRSGGFDGEPG
jgi:hypothetical protein